MLVQGIHIERANFGMQEVVNTGIVNQIVGYIAHNGMMKALPVPQEAPFADHGSIVKVFTDLPVWSGVRQAIERVNANALTA